MRALMVTIFLLLATVANADDGWDPYFFPADPAKAADYQGVPVSVFNAGKDVLDAPAGRHGYTTARDGHFYFADGTRARFWGTNLCFDACFPDKKQAEALAKRLAYFGFNAVRLHHMDYYFEPRGIFEDHAPAYKDRLLKPTGYLSRGQLDKLDYLIFQLKKRGIYININTLVSRQFSEADGVAEAEKLGIAAKPVSLFEPRLIGLQQQYAKDLLTHFNPYTRMRYCDDPAVCMVEINNENTLSDLKPSTLPEYYRKHFFMLFDMWLVSTGKKTAEGPRVNILPALDTWAMEQHSGAAMAVNEVYDAPDAAGTDGAKPVPVEIALTIKNVTPTPWHLQFRCAGVELKKGKSYMFRFSARANKPMTLGAVSQQAFDPWANLGLSESFDLTKDFQTFEAPFTATRDCDNAKVGFITGYAPGSISIKNAGLYADPTAGQIAEFKAYLEGKYLKEMRDYLRGSDIGVKCPIGIGGHWNPAQVKLQEEYLDYVDRHAYWDHPRFPDKPWDNNDFRIQNKSILADPGQGIISVIASPSEARAKQSPRTLTEWNHCYPNQFAYETPLLLAQKARENDWDALFQFAFTHSGNDSENHNNINSYFNINPNAQQLILNSFAARIFLAPADAATVPVFEITDSYAAVTFGKHTLKVGPVKNSGSGWRSDGRFDWGRAPALLKRID